MWTIAAYYNELDPNAAKWLRNLIDAGLIAPGDVDERSIKDVTPDDVAGYRQCHFFAGIGGWSLALRLAGVPDDYPVWTGSCPCQPFSAAGKRKGQKDSRHLWPWFRHLIFRCRPSVTFGEQVASADGRVWLAGVRANLETLGYAVGSADLCAAGVGAPHIRQRLWWMANARHEHPRRTARPSEAEGGRALGQPSRHDNDRWLGDAFVPRLEGLTGHVNDRNQSRRIDSHATGSIAKASHLSGMGYSAGDDEQRKRESRPDNGWNGSTGRSGAWGEFDLIPCRDGKSRRVESGVHPLAHGVSGRVGLLRGYGNAIVPEVAAEFIKACLEI